MAERILSRRYCIFFIFLFPCFASANSDADSVKSSSDHYHRISVLPVPAFGYSPETSTYIGAVALFNLHLFSDSITRTSNAKAEFNYTWRKQYITDLGWEFYTRREAYYLKGRMTFSRYPDLYYGIGDQTPLEDEIHYDSRRQVVEINILKSVAKHRYLGLILRYNNYEILDYKPGIDTGFRELIPASNIGGGLRLMLDKRNNLLNPTKGLYVDISFTANKSNHSYYSKTGLDIRYYRTLKDKHTFAFRYLGLFSESKAPFYDLSLLGGDNQVRGFLYGRYRDNNLMTLQSEYRSVIYRRWSYAVFGGLSAVNHQVFDLENKEIKSNYGAGIRFMIDRKEKTNLRLDFAMGNDGSQGFYISFGEAF